MKPQIVNLGFSVADGGGLSTSFVDEILTGIFTDYRQQEVRFRCHDTIAYRWQLAEYSLSPDERYDSVHEITESEWIKLHESQGYLRKGIVYHHYKMNFYAEGVLELICSNIEVLK